jgi:hypothetical protein
MGGGEIESTGNYVRLKDPTSTKLPPMPVQGKVKGLMALSSFRTSSIDSSDFSAAYSIR